MDQPGIPDNTTGGRPTLGSDQPLSCTHGSMDVSIIRQLTKESFSLLDQTEVHFKADGAET